MKLLFCALKNWALQVYVAKDNSILGDGHTLGDMLRGHEAGTCYSDSFPRVRHARFCEKVLWRACCMKFNRFEFVRHEAGTKLPQFSMSHYVHCTCIANCPRYNIEMNQYPLRVHQLAYCPCNMRPMDTRLGTHEGACPRFKYPRHVP